MKRNSENEANNRTNIEENNGLTISQNTGTVNYGCSYTEVKDICTIVLENKLNDYKLDALNVVNQRIDDFSKSVHSDMAVLGVDIEELKEKLSDPAIQFDFRKAELEFAKKGTEELKLMLSNILITKIKNGTNDLLDLVLSEAIDVAPKLLLKHIRTISLLFIITRTKWLDVYDLNIFINGLNSYIIPLLDNISDKRSDYLHLCYTGVAETAAVIPFNILKCWRNNYAMAFSKGFDIPNGSAIEAISKKCPTHFMKCPNNPSKFQFCFSTKEDLNSELGKNLNPSELKICSDLFDNSLMSEDEIKTLVINRVPKVEELFGLWEGNISRLSLTSVGIVLSIQYLKQITDLYYDYSIWI